MTHEQDQVEAEAELAEYGDHRPPSLWERFRLTFSRYERWRNLNWTIMAYPTVPANYVLRGELLLEQNDTLGAILDFRRALELASVQIDQEDWGVVAQALRDRARVDLQDAVRRTARYNSETS